jgi:transposase InsO family protein
MCDVLKVSRAGYYKWLETKDQLTPAQEKRQRLLERVMEIFEESNQTYGAPRVYQQLRRDGFMCSQRTVEELMRAHEIAPKRKRKYVVTTDSKHNLPIAPNVLDRQFEVESPEEVWVSDITYIDTNQGWLYLCVFIDLYSRMVVGWAMSDRMTAELVVNAFEMGVDNQGNAPIVAHSDRGSQYASASYITLLNDYGCIQSMSRKGNCWDNAVAESFFGALKSERIYRDHYETRIHASMAVFEYIEIFYNRLRLHSVLDYLTPWEKGQKGRKVA